MPKNVPKNVPKVPKVVSEDETKGISQVYIKELIPFYLSLNEDFFAKFVKRESISKRVKVKTYGGMDKYKDTEAEYECPIEDDERLSCCSCGAYDDTRKMSNIRVVTIKDAILPHTIKVRCDKCIGKCCGVIEEKQCIYVYVRGKKKGERCKTMTKDNYCFEHYAISHTKRQKELEKIATQERNEVWRKSLEKCKHKCKCIIFKKGSKVTLTIKDDCDFTNFYIGKVGVNHDMFVNYKKWCGAELEFFEKYPKRRYAFH